MGRKIGGSSSVRVTVPVSTVIEQGKFYLLDGFFGMAVQSVTTDDSTTGEVILHTESGEYETSQINAEDTMNKGTKIYYDATSKLFTTTSEGNIFVGVVTVAKDANDVIWFRFMADSAEVASALGTAKGFVTFNIPGELAAADGVVNGFKFNKAVTIKKIKARVKTLPGETAAMSFDINKGENSLFAEAPSLASTDTAGAFKEFAPDADPAQNVFAAGDVLSIDIVGAGDTAAADLEIIIEFDQSV